MTGKVFLNFEPILDKNKKIIELTDLKFKLESNQFFAKTASWLFKSEIERQVSKYAKVEIDDILTNLIFSANKKLENMELYPGLYLTADIDNVQLNTMELLQDGLSLQFEVDSDFSAKVRMQKSLTQT